MKSIFSQISDISAITIFYQIKGGMIEMLFSIERIIKIVSEVSKL